MKVALVHDYIKEYGGAERVLKSLTEIYPNAPVFTAFRVKGSTADIEFEGVKIKESYLAPILRVWRLYSPLRFLAPLIWKSFDFRKYDLVITSSSWYITRGFRVGPKTKIICYCHTPPRWLYGYETSVGFTKYWPVKIYSAIVGHFLRLYDYSSAQQVNSWIANSKNVAARIKKFYRKDSAVIYPPVDVEEIEKVANKTRKENFFLVVSRLVGGKGLEETAKVAKELGFRLKIAGEGFGFADVQEKLKKVGGKNIELLGRVTDEELYELYAKAKGFIALAKDEDFGVTPVEAMAAGTPVIAFNGGGFKETVIDGVTGVLINSRDKREIAEAVRKIKKTRWEKRILQNHARKFSKERFVVEMSEFIKKQL